MMHCISVICLSAIVDKSRPSNLRGDATGSCIFLGFALRYFLLSHKLATSLQRWCRLESAW